MERWANKVAVVTGASRGIGKVIAKALVDNGMKVVGIARNIESMREIDGKFYAVRADLRNEEEIVKAFAWILENLGPVHVLINNAVMTHFSRLLDGNSDGWRDTYATNVIGLSIATREAVNQMQEHKIDGHIVHMNSVAGHHINATIPVNVYFSSKFAVGALTETLRQELNAINSKIKITSISPGVTKTEFIADLHLEEPTLDCEDVSDAVCYVLQTPPHVQVHELIIQPVLSSNNPNWKGEALLPELWKNA